MSRVEPMIVPQAKISMLVLSSPRPVSQIKWRMPPSMWWMSAQLNRNSTKRPTIEAKKLLTVAKASGPELTASSHQASRMKPTASEIPEMRWAIDIIMVSVGR